MSNPNDYTVGWICAVYTEYVASRAFLDEEHDGPEYVSTRDDNDYTLGKVGKHNVVIAVLPDGEYGIASAANVASGMLYSFPNVRIGLMVGIGGGAPSSRHDIRLGDIVVSAPRYGKGGVFQYAFGETIQNQRFCHTGFLDQPPMVLRAAMNGLRGQYESDGHQFQKMINSILEKKKKLRQRYKRPDASSDRLYRSDFTHPPDNEGTCMAVCGDDPSNVICRPERTEDDDDPTIHYGLIASADQLMKDASVRDTLAKEKDVLCFEMEAAGLMNHFPCLVIRGICDYSDTHKNKEWQGYAAMVAAAYAKDLLCRTHPNRIEAEKSIRDMVSSVEKSINEVRDTAQGIGDNVKSLGTDHKQGKIERWLQAPDPSTEYNKALQQRHRDSGCWFLGSGAFANWKIRRNSFLWLHGIPGCGKTILSSTIVQDLESTPSSQPLLYFYFTFTESDKQSLEGMIRSLISQLYYQRKDTWNQLDLLFSACGDGRRQPTVDSMCTKFLHMLQQVGEVWIILDALDECHTRRGKRTEGTLSWMRDLLSSDKKNVHVLVTSRAEQDIASEISEWALDADIVPMNGQGVVDDIHAYIHTRIREDDDLKRWRSRPDVQDEIQTALMQKANGMFRWVTCQLDALKECLDYELLTHALTSLPLTLDETYARILDSIPESHKHKAITMLQLLVFSERSLRIKEIVDAIAVGPKGERHFNPRNRMPEPREISRFCSSFVVVVSRQEVSDNEDDEGELLQLAHFSVKAYLTSSRVQNKFKFSQDFQETTAKASIAKVCLAYLLHLDQDLQLQEIRRTFPFAQYCAEYWMEHAVESKEEDEELRLLAMEFLLRKKSYTNCYQLYAPDQPWMNDGILRRERPPAALYYASFGGLAHTVGNLIRQGADVNAPRGVYGTALYVAAGEGHKRIVELLLGGGADVNVQGNEYYGSALQVASREGHDRIVELLLDSGANVNEEGGKYGSALQAAIQKGHERIVELLLDRGANVNVQGDDRTVLQEASVGGYDRIVELLLSKGADVNGKEGRDGNALQLASRGGHHKIVELLVGAQRGNYSNTQ